MRIYKAPLLAGIGIFTLGAVVGFAQTKGDAVKEITLERTPCYGMCPVYKVTLKPDGVILYEGIRHVPKIGKYKATVYGYNKLATLVHQFGIFKMKNNYSRSITDQATAITTIKTTTGKKSIRDYGEAGPEQLWAFDRVIDSMVAEARDWEKVK